jgi:predicted RNA-binding Zn-ribbon protein involved in translation (DUF1610 family)
MKSSKDGMRTEADFEERDYRICSSCERKIYGNGYNGMCPSCGAPVESGE